MIKSIFISLKQNFYQGYNGFMYYISKILHINAYNITAIEDLIPWISIIWAILSKMVKLAFSFILYNIYIEMLFKDRFWFEEGLAKTASTGEFFIYIFSMVKLLTIIYSLIAIYNFTKKDYSAIKIMRINPKNYILGNIFYQNFIEILVTIPVLFLMANYLYKIDITLIQIASFMLFIIGFKLCFLYFSLKLKIKNKKQTDKITWYLIILMAVIALITYAYNIYYQKLIDLSIFYNPILGVLGIISTISFTILLYKNDTIDSLVYSLLNKKDNYDNQDLKDVQVKAYKIDEKNITKNDVDYSKYIGIAYINKIFFDRTKSPKFIKRNLRAIIISLGIIAIVSYLYITNTKLPFEDIKDAVKYAPIVSFVLPYFLFDGNSFVRKCFVNLDVKLIKYNFYRQPKIIFESIKVRGLELIKENSIPGLIYLIGLGFLCHRLNFSNAVIIRTIIFGLIGIIFFSFHYLFMYYIIQPFTESAEAKNPLYNITTWIMYMLITIFSSILGGDKIQIALLVFILLYLIFVIYGILKIAPKHYKLR